MEMEQAEVTKYLLEMREDIAILTEQIKGAFKRIDDQKQLTESVHRLATSVEILASEQKRMGEEQVKLRTDVDALRLKPATRWEEIVKQLVTLIVAAAVGGAIMKLFV